MTDEPAPLGNIAEYSVSEISFAVKRTVEDVFGHVRVRGELGRVSRPASGHIYLDLKDDKAVLAGVIWRGAAAKLKVKPEQGLEVVCTGRLTTYPGQSKYQMVIESMEPAGVGALMALLEERKKKLAAEGLFAAERKRALPYLPEVIGVVTSPTGAVIRDILHRLNDRFPRHVLIWPVRVQGEQSAEEVAAAIHGFNRLSGEGAVPRPDVLIVARGGGSLEDLWSFNEEIVVRAAAESGIPLISAVGHETDVTLIDYAADRRAPTPTAAAEMAVPVRADLVASVLDLSRRMVRAESRFLEQRRQHVTALARGLPRLADLLGLPRQRFDAVSDRLGGALRVAVKAWQGKLERAAGGLRPAALEQRIGQNARLVGEQARRLDAAAGILFKNQRSRLESAAKLLDAYSHQSVLERGFALVMDDAGHPLRRAADTRPGLDVRLQFADDAVGATVTGAPRPQPAKPAAAQKAPKPAAAKKSPAKKSNPSQGTLL